MDERAGGEESIMDHQTEKFKETVEVEKTRSQFGDFRSFTECPTKEQVSGAVAEIICDLMDSLKEVGKDLYDINNHSFVIVPKQPIEGHPLYTIGVKLLLEY